MEQQPFVSVLHLMHYSSCSVFTDNKMDQILMMPPFLMVAYKDLRL